MNFAALGVPASLAQILEQQGITTPTPIQAATLPDSLAGRDVLGRGRTGSGKTYAFLLPLVARLDASKMPAMPRKPRALILAPTRELVGQIHAALQPLARAAGLSSVVVYGGVGQNPQTTALKKGVDIVIACPGRLEDLMGQGYADLSAIEVTILDEADHMADLGFLPGVRRIMDKTPRQGQRMLFSATLDKAIDVLVKRYLDQPKTHEADSAQSPISTMHHHVLHLSREQRVPVLVDLTSAPGRTVVFTRTKHGAKALARQLNKSGVPTVDLHGNLSQNARTRNMEAFHSGTATTLVATDIAARGIHVDDVALVIHADPPTEHKAYLHRSGRTARAGAEGTVITLMTDEQQRDVRDLTRLAGIKPTTTKVNGPGHAMLEQLAPGVRSTPGGLTIDVPTSTGGGGRSNGANAQRKRARSTGQTNGQSRRGNPTSYTSETPGSGSGSTGGGQRRRSGGGDRWRPGWRSGPGPGRWRQPSSSLRWRRPVRRRLDRRSRAQRVVVQPRSLTLLDHLQRPPARILKSPWSLQGQREPDFRGSLECRPPPVVHPSTTRRSAMTDLMPERSTTRFSAPASTPRSASTRSAMRPSTAPRATTPRPCARSSPRPSSPTGSASTTSGSASTTAPTTRSPRPTSCSPRSPGGPSGSASARASPCCRPTTRSGCTSGSRRSMR